jgi:hypothetical protein
LSLITTYASIIVALDFSEFHWNDRFFVIPEWTCRASTFSDSRQKIAGMTVKQLDSRQEHAGMTAVLQPNSFPPHPNLLPPGEKEPLNLLSLQPLVLLTFGLVF